MSEISVEFALAAARARAMRGDGTAVGELDVVTENGPLLIGVDSAERRHLFVPVADGEAVEHHDGTALRIVERALPVGGPTRVADLYCSEPALDDVFERFVDSTVGMIREMGPEASAHATLHDAVALWRTLLSERRTRREDEQGLFGELHVLSLIGRHDPVRALAAWRGPNGARHDFMAEHGALEVKAIGLQATEVPISSLAQLDPAGSPRLGLVTVRLEERPEGLSVDELADQLVADGFPEALLRSRFPSMLGEGAATPRRYVVHATSLYTVDADFPSLRADDIPAAKRPHVAVRYALILEGLDALSVDDESLVNFLTGEEKA